MTFPVVPGPGEPTEPQQPIQPPPQVIYVQASGPQQQAQTQQAVTKGILDAGMWVVIAVLAVCVGVPSICCLNLLKRIRAA